MAEQSKLTGKGLGFYFLAAVFFIPAAYCAGTALGYFMDGLDGMIEAMFSIGMAILFAGASWSLFLAGARRR